MYGLEKEKGGNKFMFDLELRIKGHPQQGKELIEKAEAHVQEIKKALREGASEKEFDQLGILLHGYTAFIKVLKKAAK